MSRYYDYSSGISWNSQALSSVGGGGKDPLSAGMGGRPVYPHPTVSGGYAPQDSRSQQMQQVQAQQNIGYAPYHGYGATAGTAQLAAIPAPSPSSALPPYPIHPDIKFKNLPFYDVLAQLMKPSSMLPMQPGRMQEGNFMFHLTPEQATEMATSKEIVGLTNKIEFNIQAQLRFCLLDTSTEQEDYFPPSVSLKINGKICPLPNPLPTNKPTPEPKRPPRPVNISALVKLSPTVSNTINVTWAADFTRAHVLCVFMVRKLTSCELLTRLKNKGTKNADYTRQIIREKLAEDYDSDVATTSLRVSLMCPLGKLKMSNPCRSANCTHLQCFDASLFLQMNERRPTWLCPVCNRPAPYETLLIDGYFDEVLSSSQLASDCSEVLLHKDGSWSAPDDEPEPAAKAQPKSDPVTLISDDVEIIPVEAESEPAPKKKAVPNEDGSKPADMVDLTSDSEDELPLKRKVPQAKASPTVPVEKADETCNNNGAEVVSSSGYLSPSAAGVISLDSPSPPAPCSPPPPVSESLPDGVPEHPRELTITAINGPLSAPEGEVPQTPWAPYADNGGSGEHFRRY